IRDKLVTGVQTCALPIFTGGVATNHVLFNFATSGTDIHFGGGGTGATGEGIYLSTLRKIDLGPGTVLGEVIGGNDITITSGGRVIGVPEPSSCALVLTALGILGAA